MRAFATTGAALLFVSLAVVAFAGAPTTQESRLELAAWRIDKTDWLSAGHVELDPIDPRKLQITPGAGLLVNGSKGRTANLLSRDEFGDIQAHIEFLISEKSNSGVYFMGRYELQIYDSFGVEKDQYPGIECGGIYPRWIDGRGIEGHSPDVNASLAAGKWQTFDVKFRAPRFDAAGKKIANARFVEVFHNGKRIHHDLEVTGPTRSAAFDDERATGPLMLQGDHGPVAFRSITVTPLEQK